MSARRPTAAGEWISMAAAVPPGNGRYIVCNVYDPESLDILWWVAGEWCRGAQQCEPTHWAFSLERPALDGAT